MSIFFFLLKDGEWNKKIYNENYFIQNYNITLHAVAFFKNLLLLLLRS
jgi:hypothetical protein